MNIHEGWALPDRTGVLHAPLRANDEDAWWTPTACGGVVLPWAQRVERFDCADCWAAIKQDEEVGTP